jgi:hypothetical protein
MEHLNKKSTVILNKIIKGLSTSPGLNFKCINLKWANYYILAEISIIKGTNLKLIIISKMERSKISKYTKSVQVQFWQDPKLSNIYPINLYDKKTMTRVLGARIVDGEKIIYKKEQEELTDFANRMLENFYNIGLDTQ